MPLSNATDDHDREQELDNESYDGQAADRDGVDDTQVEKPVQKDRIDDFLKPLQVDEATFYQLASRFSDVYRDLARNSEKQFLPTPVTSLPTGLETGRYLAIDVGGSNLRVAFIDLLGGPDQEGEGEEARIARSRDTVRKAQRQRVRRSLEKSWPIGEHFKNDNAEDLFLWIGDCMAEVVTDSLTPEFAKGDDIPKELELGITFSFPMMQDSLTEAKLLQMGKGFAFSSNLNLGDTLLDGYDRHTKRPADEDQPTAKRRKLFALPKLKIAAITNDAVATLAALAYLVKSLPNSRVAMSIIVGTGCNATIPISLSDLSETKAKHVLSRHPGATETVVNTEWTLGGAAPPLRELNITTKWDEQLDEQTAAPGFQPFEYMTGGRYIGELVRIIFFDYITNVVGLEEELIPKDLLDKNGIDTSYLSSIVAQTPSDTELMQKLNTTKPAPSSSSWSWDAETARALRKTARTVQTRSAGLIAAAVVGLLACKGELKLRHDGSKDARPRSGIIAPSINGTLDTIAGSNNKGSEKRGANGPVVPIIHPSPSGWESGPEELVVAYTGGIIQKYPNFKETCQRYIDRLVIWDGPQESGKSVFLREASDGGIIGAGVLAGMIANS